MNNIEECMLNKPTGFCPECGEKFPDETMPENPEREECDVEPSENRHYGEWSKS